MLYTIDTSSQAVTLNTVLALGETIAKTGCGVRQSGNTIEIAGTGKYKITGTVEGTTTADGKVSVSVYRDGVLMPGSVFTTDVTAGKLATVPILAVVKMKNCPCQDPANITLVWSGDVGTVYNVVTETEAI